MALTAVLTDDFNRANEDLDASADWTEINAYFGSAALSSNAVTDGSSSALTNVTAAAHNDDQYAQADVTPQVGYGGSVYVRLGVRITGTVSGGGSNTVSGYILQCNTAGTMELFESTSGTETSLWTSGASAIADGDEIRLEATGSSTTTINVYVNDTLEDAGSGYTAQDSTSPHTSGKPGLAINQGGAFLDNWESGNITSGTTITATSVSKTLTAQNATVGTGSDTNITATAVSKTISTTSLSFTFNTNGIADSKSATVQNATVYIGGATNITATVVSKSITTQSAALQAATLGLMSMGAFRYELSADGDTPVQMGRGRTRLKLSGTFGGGTAKLQERDASEAWVDVANGSFTAATDTVFDFPYGPTNRFKVNLSGSTSPALVVQIDSQ